MTSLFEPTKNNGFIKDYDCSQHVMRSISPSAATRKLLAHPADDDKRIEDKVFSILTYFISVKP